MTLAEIENILGELTARHPDLTVDALHTMLISAGWEDRLVKDTLMLYKQGVNQNKNIPKGDQVIKQKSETLDEVVVASLGVVDEEKDIPFPPVTNGIVFYTQDNKEEGDLPIFVQEELVDTRPPEVVIEKELINAPEVSGQSESEIDSIPIVSQAETIDIPVINPVVFAPKEINEGVQGFESKQDTVLENTPLTTKTMLPESLIQPIQQEEKRVEQKNVELPANLPLLPFESSPHIWPFSKYKDVFHGEEKKEEAYGEQPVSVVSAQPTRVPDQITQSGPVVSKETPTVTQAEGDEEITLEKTPLTKGDESLVFLAGVMLLAIILILGYMYSNGRL